MQAKRCLQLVDDFDMTEYLELGGKAQEEEEEDTAVYCLQYSISLKYKEKTIGTTFTSKSGG